MSRKKTRSRIEHHGAGDPQTNGIEPYVIIVDDLMDDSDLKGSRAAELASRWAFSRDLVKRARQAGAI